MNSTDALHLRLVTQRLAGEPFDSPEQVVRWLTGAQSQDFASAKWSVGQRCRGCADADVQVAFNSGKILRTHILRPTWHFVSPSDIRWMLGLTSPHVQRLNAHYYRKLELEKDVLVRGQAVLAKALAGGNQLTRAEVSALLANAGITPGGFRPAYIMMHAELEGLVCSGAMRGKQQTYALLDERVSNERNLEGDEALAELTRRFFVSHGPATLKEYGRWSGLPLADCRTGLEMVKGSLAQETLDGQVHWFDASINDIPEVPFTSYLLPEYDECYLTYPAVNFPDLPWVVEPERWKDTYFRPIIIGGHRAGTWRRTISRKQIVMEANLFSKLDDDQLESLRAAVQRYGEFLCMPVSLIFSR